MPSIAANPAVKAEKSLVLDVPESFKLAVTVVEKKCRNLEKRKTKLDGYRDELARGKSLSEEQKQAVARYDEVIATLDLSREYITAFEKLALETSKGERKRKKQEAIEKQQYELLRFKEIFTFQEVFSSLLNTAAREDFLKGLRGAPVISEADLQKLDTFFGLVTIDNQNLPGSFNDAVTNTATHFQNLLEGRNKDVAGSSYRELKDLLMSIVQNGYFDWKPQPEPAFQPEVEPEVEPSITETYQEAPEMYTPHVTSGIEMVEPIIPLPVMPAAPQYFPVDVETDFNFIQESMIDEPVLSMTPSVPMPVAAAAVPVSLASMDSAVVMVHQQVPAHFYMQGNPGPQIYSPIVPPQTMVHPSSILTSDICLTDNMKTDLPTPAASALPVPASSAPADTQGRTSSPWDEDPLDEVSTYQEPNRNESNTWTNSSYRSNDQEANIRRGTGPYRGNRSNSGGQRGGSRGGSGGYYNNSRNYGDRQERSNGERSHSGNNGGERSYRGTSGERSYQSGGGSGGGGYQGNGNERYQNNQGNGSYQGNQYRSGRGGNSYAPRGGNGGNGGYRGTSSRGGPRGGSSNRGFDRNSTQAKDQ